MKRCKLVAATLLILALFAPVVTAGPVTISPQMTRITIAPGGHGRQSITVTNNMETILACRIETADWTAAPGVPRGREFHAAGTQERSCTPWMLISSDEFDLGTGESREISISVALPDTAEGSYFGALLFRVTPETPPPSKGVTTRISLNLDHLVTVDTEGRTTWAASVDTIYISRPDDNKPLVITTVLKNEGNAGLRPEGSFSIVDDMETVWGTVEVRDYVIQPGGSGLVSEEWEGILLPQPYDLKGTINIGGDKTLTPKLRFSVTNWMRIAGITVSEKDDSLIAVVQITNKGNITSTVDVLLEIRNAGGYRKGQLDRSDVTVLPDETSELLFTLPELETGGYELTVSIDSPEHQTDATIRFKAP
ncbi:MAG: hypothetical protein ABIJ00_13740 [Candidatus Eisenbacteria bacterium]